MKSCDLFGLTRDFVHAALVAATFEVGGEEDVDEGQGLGFVNIIGGQTEDIGVVMLARETCERFVPAQRSADAGMMVAGHGDAVAGGADGDAEVVLSLFDGRSHRMGEIGIVAAVG